jgi:hypothetical protein
MKNFLTGIIAFIFLAVFSGLLLMQRLENKNAALPELRKDGAPRLRSSFSPHNRREAIERMEYELRRLRDPQTGRIPENMRARELEFANHLPNRELALQKSAGPLAENWSRRGPFNVGGRTRALAIDLNYNGTSNRRILAGGISGGMFLSEDDGSSWKMTTTLAQLASVTCLAQDRNNTSVWYFGSGELLGNSAAGRGAYFYGQGIFKSTDGGNNWTQLASTIQNNKVTVFDSFFDFVWNIAIHPQSSAVFAATYGGIMRSTDGGNSWQLVLGRNQSPYSIATDVAIGSDGNVYATLSRNGGGFSEYGVYRSTNSGANWSNVTPAALASDPYRMVLGIAPSDPNTIYLLVQATEAGANAQDHQLFRYNAGTNTWTNFSSRLPDVPNAPVGTFNSQGGYDLVVKVKPDNPNTFWIGGTNLYRSTDGGQNFTFVGGYRDPNTVALYPNHHPDQHSMTFYPNNANAMISGHDGGLSKTTNALQTSQTWTSLNNGYLTTQLYTVALDPNAGSNFIIGGLQDNGCWYTETNAYETPWTSLPSGDGAYCAVAPGGLPFYFSSQSALGFYRATVSNNQLVLSIVRPAGISASSFLFITPYLLDPNDSRVMYLAAGNAVWRNSNLDQIPAGNPQETSINWSALSNSATAGRQVTALVVSKTPANRLYFGATDYQSSTSIVRVDNAPGNPAGTNITPAGVQGGAYPSCISVNPNNADEIIAVFSNYRIASLWHSTNGGGSWTDIEGNLAGDDGPSIRWATIVPIGSGRTYLLATSTGVYSTTTLNGANTAWAQEGATPIGNVVVDMIVGRPSDGLVVAGTHGRGVYSAQLSGGGTANLNVNVAELNIALPPGTTRSVQFNLGNTGTAALNYNITATGPATNGAIHARANLENDFNPPVPKFDFTAITTAHGSARRAGESSPPMSALALENFADDVLVYDDGNNTADDFIGFGPNSANDFYWLNTFTPSGFSYRLESFDFYMRTETAGSNPVYVGVLDANGNILAQGNLTLATAPNGSFYFITVNPNLTFNDGQSFAIVVGASRFIPYPAGADVDAAVPNRSFYFNPSTNQYVNLNTISGFQNGAFIIRAHGAKIGPANQPPIARAQVSPNPANVNQNITFDASTSSDPDGQITQYLWNFGDGTTSNQITASHAYAQAGNFTYTLTVTDNGGATGQTSGQVTITSTPARLTVNPANGSVAPNSSQTITVTFNAQGLAEGNYQGQLSITSNGGNLILPVRITVSSSVKVDEPRSELPRAFTLEQNYPNPFKRSTESSPQSPETKIRYSLPSSGEVYLRVYNLRGEIVTTLFAGPQAAGEHVVHWDGRNHLGARVASGIYLYRLEMATAAGVTNLTKKLTVMK